MSRKNYVTSSSREHCSRLQQSRCFIPLLTMVWFFAAYTAEDYQCFSVGQTTLQHCPFLWGISYPSNTWFLGLTRVSMQAQPPNGISIDSAFSTAYTCYQHIRPLHSAAADWVDKGPSTKNVHKKYVVLHPPSPLSVGWVIYATCQHKNRLHRGQDLGWRFSSARLRMANDTVISRPRCLFVQWRPKMGKDMGGSFKLLR